MNSLTKAVVEACANISGAVRDEWVAQGHHLSGAWEDSLTAEVADDGTNATGYATAYGLIVNAGVQAGRIPYGGPKATPGEGGTSKYIEGLINYFIARGLGPEEAMRAAFATANVHKKEGLSTAASSRFSSNGQRQEFVQAVDKALGAKVDEVIVKGADVYVFDELIQEPKKVIY